MIEHHENKTQHKEAAEGVEEFKAMMQKHDISLPQNITAGLNDQQMEVMSNVALGLVPLWENCLGADWQKLMPPERVRQLLSRM